MASRSVVRNKVTDFGRVLLPVGRRVVEELFRVSMFLFVLPNVSDETTTRDLHGKP
jgi:hypothetical protein